MRQAVVPPGPPALGRAAHGARRARGAVGRTSLRLLAGCLVAACARCGGGLLCWSSPKLGGRRDLLGAGAAAGILGAGPGAADAFPNAIKKIKREMNDPKRPGPEQEDLGLAERTDQSAPGLKECGNPPNCFSTTYKELDVGLHDLQPWHFSGKSPEAAMKEVLEAVQGYEPGQRGIDGGGFAVKAQGPDFVYVQFESLKKGHLDDVEFHLAPGTQPGAKEGDLLVRSSSRLGFFDFGVNAIRLNRIANDLEKSGGWTLRKIDQKSHPRYWGFNCEGGQGSKAPFSVIKKFPEMCTG